MLSSISWLQFSTFIFLGLVGYYGYVLVRYYGRELNAWLTGRPYGLEKTVEPGEAAGTLIEEPLSEQAMPAPPVIATGVAEQVASPAQGQQASLFTALAEVRGEQDLFKVTDKAIGTINTMLNAARGSTITREEIEERLRSVLQGYQRLRDTPHQEAIDQIIQRACRYLFNIRLEPEALEKLWN
jgi:hypothetical protein